MMLMEGSPAVTRMVRASEEGFRNTVASKEEGSSPSTYEIVMVSLSGSLLLLVAISVAISVLRRRCTSNHSSKDLTTPVVVENITVTNSSSDKISTADLTGPHPPIHRQSSDGPQLLPPAAFFWREERVKDSGVYAGELMD